MRRGEEEEATRRRSQGLEEEFTLTTQRGTEQYRSGEHRNLAYDAFLLGNRVSWCRWRERGEGTKDHKRHEEKRSPGAFPSLPRLFSSLVSSFCRPVVLSSCRFLVVSLLCTSAEN